MQDQRSYRTGGVSTASRSDAGPSRAGWALLGGFALAVTLFALSTGPELPDASEEWHGNAAVGVQGD